MRCPSCEKFVSLELQDPEFEGLEITEDGQIAGSVRIVRTCADCSDEMKEANFEVQAEVPADVLSAFRSSHPDAGDLEIEAEIEPIEEGGGRYAKSFFGATISFKVT